MKSIYLALLRIEHYFSRNKFIFILYFLGLILCSVVCCFFIGNGNVGHNRELAFSARSYKISPTSSIESEQAIKAMEEVKKSIDYEAIMFSFDIKTDDIHFEDKNINLLGHDYGDGSSTKISVASFVNDSHIYLLEESQSFGRTNFSKQEKEGKNVIVFHNNYMNDSGIKNFEKAVSDKLTIGNNNFVVIGTTLKDLADAYIPYNTYKKLEFPVDEITMTMPVLPTSEENKKIVTEIVRGFSDMDIDVSIEDLGFWTAAVESAENTQKSYSIVIMAIIFCVFVFLMKYMMERSLYETVVFGTVGADSKQLIIIMLIENILLVLPTSVLGFIVYDLTKDILFKDLMIAPNYIYTFGDYAFIFVAMLVVSIVVSLPFYLFYLRKSLVKLKNIYAM